MRFIILDSANLFFRCKHIAQRGTDAWTKVGFGMHLTLSSAAKEYREHNGDHVVFALEGQNSWRKKFYTPYKWKRAAASAAKTQEMLEEDELFFDAYNDLIEFLDKGSNCTVLQVEGAEGDDVIAHWTQIHPHDEHVIVSSDTDFIQLVSPNVSQFNAITKQLITIKGILDEKGQPVVDKKSGVVKPDPEPQWELFLKCIRGDTSDNVFSAFPGARLKGTKNKVGIREAFEDRVSQGYNWNNFMLQRWLDHKQEEHKVLEDYDRNVTLIDLTKQPTHIRESMDIALANAYMKQPVKQVGSHLLRFCGKYELENIAKYPDGYAKFLNAGLPEI